MTAQRREAGLRPDQCSHCHQPIVWGTLQNGQHRSFDRQPQPVADVAPAARYAYSRRARAVVNLDGEQRPPPLVLVEHFCLAYVEHRERQRDARLAALSPASIAEALGAEP